MLASFETKFRAALARFARDAAPFGEGPLSLAQITLGCCLSYLDFRFAHIDWRTAHPNLALHYDKLAARPSFQETVPPQAN